MIVQCEYCHRIRLDGEWVMVRPGIHAQVMGFCAHCGDIRKAEQEAKWEREDRKLLRDRERGYGPQAGDPFENMREPRPEKGRG